MIAEVIEDSKKSIWKELAGSFKLISLNLIAFVANANKESVDVRIKVMAIENGATERGWGFGLSSNRMSLNLIWLIVWSVCIQPA